MEVQSSDHLPIKGSCGSSPGPVLRRNDSRGPPPVLPTHDDRLEPALAPRRDGHPPRRGGRVSKYEPTYRGSGFFRGHARLRGAGASPGSPGPRSQVLGELGGCTRGVPNQVAGGALGVVRPWPTGNPGCTPCSPAAPSSSVGGGGASAGDAARSPGLPTRRILKVPFAYA